MALLPPDMSAVPLKLSHAGLLRRIAAPDSWTELAGRISGLFGLPQGATVAATYVDDDGDRITVDTDGEYRELVAQAARESKPVRLDVLVGGSQASNEAYVLVENAIREGVEKMSIDSPIMGQASSASAPTPTPSPMPPSSPPCPASPPAYDDTYPIFLAAVQPLVDQLLIALDSAPREHIPRLLGDLSGMLATRNWGLTVQSEDGMPVEPDLDRKEAPSSSFGSEVNVWYGVVCDGCMQHNIPGTRYRCDDCSNYDLCSSCHANCSAIHNPAHTFTPIANISDWWPKVVCDKCNRTGIAGNRYKCNSCVDYDLCGRCYEDSDSFHEHGKPAFSNLGSRGEDRARKIEHLKAMGFGDERTNELLLNRFDNDIQRVVSALLKRNQYAQQGGGHHPGRGFGAGCRGGGGGWGRWFRPGWGRS